MSSRGVQPARPGCARRLVIGSAMRDAKHMTALVFAMILCLVLGMAVVGVVAIPARREGRDVLTPRGEDVVNRVKERTESVAVARGRGQRQASATAGAAATGGAATSTADAHAAPAEPTAPLTPTEPPAPTSTQAREAS